MKPAQPNWMQLHEWICSCRVHVCGSHWTSRHQEKTEWIQFAHCVHSKITIEITMNSVEFFYVLSTISKQPIVYSINIFIHIIIISVKEYQVLHVHCVDATKYHFIFNSLFNFIRISFARLCTFVVVGVSEYSVLASDIEQQSCVSYEWSGKRMKKRWNSMKNELPGE